MSEEIQATYFAWRRTGVNGDVTWLYAVINDWEHLTDRFYAKESYQRVEWKLGASPTRFETERDAARRSRCKAITRDAKNNTRARWDLVEIKLIAQTKIVKTTADDAVTKLGMLAEMFVA